MFCGIRRKDKRYHKGDTSFYSLYITDIIVGHNVTTSTRRDASHQPNKTNTQLTLPEYVVISDFF